VAVIAGVLGRAGERGQERRRADALEGIVPWQTPLDVVKFIKEERKSERDEREAKQAEEQGDSGREEPVEFRSVFKGRNRQ
jgi:small subunit ribosomal protein S2